MARTLIWYEKAWLGPKRRLVSNNVQKEEHQKLGCDRVIAADIGK